MDIYTFGHDIDGILGRGVPTNSHPKPKKIDLVDKVVVDVKCSYNRTYLLTETNQLYHLGGGVYIPTFLHSFNDHKIIKISCSYHNSLALSCAGKVYSWYG